MSTPHSRFIPDGSDLVDLLGIKVTPVVDTRTCVILHGSDDIMYVRYRPGVEVTLDDAKEYDGLMKSYLRAHGLRANVLVDPMDNSILSDEARAYHATTEDAKLFRAVAIIARTPLTQAIGGFFIFLNQPIVPTRLFTSFAEAREWLLRMKKEDEEADKGAGTT